MYKNYEIVEVTKENKDEYLNKIVNLENIVYDIMKNEGKEGQFFNTGNDGILEYINSENDRVLIGVKCDNENGDKNVIAATYITGCQTPFSYNDITKYFKCDSKYQDYIQEYYEKGIKKEINNKKQSNHVMKYAEYLESIYRKKILSFIEARRKILNDRGIKGLSNEEENKKLLELIEQNGQKFDERNKIRSELNEYMYKYMKLIGCKDDYEKCYWVNLDFVKSNKKKEKSSIKQFFNKIRGKKDDLENEVNISDMETYDKILELQKYKIYEQPQFNELKYYNANTNNTIEIDTYITSPYEREKGIARILVLEGIKKSLYDRLRKAEGEDIFLVSTLHRENLSSKYVSEFFGLKDYLFVNRREGRDREVHILGLKRNEVLKYIRDMEKKIAVLYDYNPNGIVIYENEKLEILREQLKYEIEELKRLKLLDNEDGKKKYIKHIEIKYSKIKQLNSDIKKINNDKKNRNDSFTNENKSNEKCEKGFHDRIKFDVSNLQKLSSKKKEMNDDIKQKDRIDD